MNILLILLESLHISILIYFNYSGFLVNSVGLRLLNYIYSAYSDYQIQTYFLFRFSSILIGLILLDWTFFDDMYLICICIWFAFQFDLHLICIISLIFIFFICIPFQAILFLSSGSSDSPSSVLPLTFSFFFLLVLSSQLSK